MQLQQSKWLSVRVESKAKAFLLCAFLVNTPRSRYWNETGQFWAVVEVALGVSLASLGARESTKDNADCLPGRECFAIL